jgi:hypothetical protein
MKYTDNLKAIVVDKAHLVTVRMHVSGIYLVVSQYSFLH